MLRSVVAVVASVLSLPAAYHEPRDNTAEKIWLRHMAAIIKAEGNTLDPLEPWLPAATGTWNRMRHHVLSTSMVDPVRLLATAMLAHRSIGVEGDFVETGVARGGSSILMMAVLDDTQVDKRHFACDSFHGLPEGTPKDHNSVSNCSSKARGQGAMSGALSCGYHGNLKLTDALRTFRGQFTYGRREFVQGWFNESLPPEGLNKIAFLRLDGDLYASTHDALEALYPRVASGGAIYVDDYGSFGGCRLAVDEYRERHGIHSPMTRIWTNFTPPARRYKFLTPQAREGYGFEGVWWIKS
jgi:hypothetical protein